MGYASTDIKGFDFIQLYVGNARHSAVFYAALFGFEIVGYRGSETGERETVSYLLHQNDLIFVITASQIPDTPVNDFVRLHGDGVAEISVRVADVAAAQNFAVSNGAERLGEPQSIEDDHGRFQRASIQIYGDTVLTFVNRDHYRDVLPGFGPYNGPQFKRTETNLMFIDHIVGNVPVGEMDRWASFFEKTMDLETYIHFDKGDISTQYSALVSKVVRSKNAAVKFPINEPAEGKKKSQIDEYLEVNRGPGVQHIAIRTNDIVTSISALRNNGVTFIPTPDTYYEVIAERAKVIDEDLEDLKKLSILFDDEGEGYLLQLFTQPIADRPTLFYEFIQRKGSEGFGQNNFQSLFESIEREQARRGNL